MNQTMTNPSKSCSTREPEENLPEARIHESLLPHDLARLEYGRLLWKNQKRRIRLLDHWADARHPYHHRFKIHRKQIERILNAPADQDDKLDGILQAEGSSLRALVREIPPVFGSFYGAETPPDRI